MGKLHKFAKEYLTGSSLERSSANALVAKVLKAIEVSYGEGDYIERLKQLIISDPARYIPKAQYILDTKGKSLPPETQKALRALITKYGPKALNVDMKAIGNLVDQAENYILKAYHVWQRQSPQELTNKLIQVQQEAMDSPSGWVALDRAFNSGTFFTDLGRKLNINAGHFFSTIRPQLSGQWPALDLSSVISPSTILGK